MPLPTNPPWSGSCPEPPPETSAPLPGTGASLRRTSWFSASMRTRSACASPRPVSDSLTTSAGSLMNFFTLATATLTSRSSLDDRGLGAVGLGDGFLDGVEDPPRRRDEVVCECRDSGTNEVCRKVGAKEFDPVVRVRPVDRLHE